MSRHTPHMRAANDCAPTIRVAVTPRRLENLRDHHRDHHRKKVLGWKEHRSPHNRDTTRPNSRAWSPRHAAHTVSLNQTNGRAQLGNWSKLHCPLPQRLAAISCAANPFLVPDAGVSRKSQFAHSHPNHPKRHNAPPTSHYISYPHRTASAVLQTSPSQHTLSSIVA